jgi:spermidine/putrescine transport system permease protein
MAGFAAAGEPASAPHHSRMPGFLAWLALFPVVAWLVLFVVAPLILLVAVSFADRDSLGRIVYDFNLDNYTRAFNWVWLKVLLDSVWYAFLTTILCMAIGYPVAYFIGRAPERWRSLLLLMVMVPFWTSFLIRTYAWITILAKDGLLNAILLGSGLIAEPMSMLYTPFAIVLGLVYNFLPFMILPIYTSVEKLDNAMIEAAYDLGAGPLRAFSQVIIPLTRPGIAAGAMLVFIPSIAMFAITTLMGGGANPTIGEVIFKQFTAGRNQPFGAALGTILLAIFIVALWLSRRQREDES